MIASTLTEFWRIYDEYITSDNQSLKPVLHTFLADQNENIYKLERPEKGQNHVLAWEVLKQHTFHFPRATLPFEILEGEIIVVQHGWDRDVFCTRIPRQEFVCGHLLSMTEREGRIFLPLYEPDVIRAKVMSFYKKHLSYALEFLSKEEAEVWNRYKT